MAVTPFLLAAPILPPLCDGSAMEFLRNCDKREKKKGHPGRSLSGKRDVYVVLGIIPGHLRKDIDNHPLIYMVLSYFLYAGSNCPFSVSRSSSQFVSVPPYFTYSQ